MAANQQHFHPQIVTAPNGAIGCVFYEFGPKPTTPLIDVVVARSFDQGVTFGATTVTDQPWDPTVDAPWSHGDHNVTFIGDYMGFDASADGFRPVWTDTRTGIQELWTTSISSIPAYAHQIPLEWLAIIFGIIQDGGGTGYIGGHLVHIPPLGPPEVDILLGVAIQRLASLVSGRDGLAVQQAALTRVARVAEKAAAKVAAKEQGSAHG